MESNFNPSKNNKKNPPIKTNQFQDIVLLGEAMMIIAIISAFIMSRFVIELTLIMNAYLVILAFMMAYTNYSIYKRKAMTIIYLIFGLIILLSIFIGI